jgi:osmotically-inducible protein OsmY
MTTPIPLSPDTQDLRGRIEDALWEYEPVRSSDLPLRLDVTEQGQVRLQGWVRSRVIKDTIRAIVSSVAGVTGLDNQLVADPDLEIQAARALADAPGLGRLPVGDLAVRAHLGAVGIVGRVPDEATRRTAADVVEKTLGVRRVVDSMEVRQS